MPKASGTHRSMDRRLFVSTTAGACAGLAAAALLRHPARAQPRKSRPNVLFIIADDQRWDTMSCAGNPVLKTPNLDRIAAEGARFANSFSTTSICAPARASFLTGKYAYRNGVRDLGIDLPDDQKTFLELLRDAGYETGYVGKYHLGGNEHGQKRVDYWGGFPGQGKYKQGDQHLTDILGQRAVDFLRQEHSKPFCLAVGFKAPHCQDGATPEFQYAPRFESLFKDVEIPYPPTFEGTYEKKPECVRESLGRTRWGWRFATREMFQETVKSYYRLIAGVDEAVGRMLDTLDQIGAADNTLVIFTGDQGFLLGDHGLAGKWLMYEESIRMPLLMRYPPLQRAGLALDELVLNIDVAPTVLDLCGVPIPADMQGHSVRPLLEGKPEANWRTAFLYEYFGGHNVPAIEGVRTRDWKCVRYLADAKFQPAEELYSMAWDPHETTDLATDGQYVYELEFMKQLLEQLKLDTRGAAE